MTVPNKGLCENCKAEFNYNLINNGFNESSYAYCDKCGKTALFDTNAVPDSLKAIFNKDSRHNVISEEIEGFIMPCDCGGSYRHNVSPRCPHCNNELSAVSAAEYVEDNSPGAKKGWKWQGNWTGLYAIIVEGKSVNNCWREQKLK